jgi:hypothetical protein
MHRAWVLVVALCAGCFSKPGFGGNGDGGTDGSTDGASDGSIDATPCTATWPSPNPVSGLNGWVTGEPTITGDLEELYWAYEDGPEWQIHWAEVTQPGTLAYTYKGQVAFTILDGTDPDPSITDDGLLMVYREGPSNIQTQMRQVTRASRMAPWTAPVDVPGLGGTSATTLDISGDGLTLYYNLGTTLRYATRGDRLEPFVQQATQLGTGLLFPAISGDQLSVYFTMGTSGVYTAKRSGTSSGFLAPDAVFSSSSLHDPDVTQDDTTMVIATRDNYTIAFSQRACP